MVREEEVTSSDNEEKGPPIGYRFGPFTLDLEQASLLRDGSPVKIPRKSFEILTLLVKSSGRIVDKNEIMESIWPETFVEDANLTVHISNLRKTLAVDPATNIETYAKQGYRFVSDIQPFWPPALSNAPAAPADAAQEEAGGQRVAPR